MVGYSFFLFIILYIYVTWTKGGKLHILYLLFLKTGAQIFFFFCIVDTFSFLRSRSRLLDSGCNFFFFFFDFDSVKGMIYSIGDC